MGLAGRKVKRRIGNDPRNLSWADDAARFGQNYLSKFGWDASQGLGVSGEGRTSHIKVHQKLDMYGIGAAHQKDPNGIAWKQNKDFESLLRRLNGGEGDTETVGTKLSGFSKAKELSGDNEGEEADGQAAGEKRKADEVEDANDDDEQDKKRRKKEKKEKKEKSKKSKRSGDVEGEASPSRLEEDVEASPAPETTTTSRSSSVPIIRGHRARFIRAKRMALADSAAVSEILGISRNATPTITTSTTPEPSAEPEAAPLEQLTTSSKSVMDYFKEKLLAKSNSKASSSSNTPIAKIPPDAGERDPRGGLGSSNLRHCWTTAETQDEEHPLRGGLGASRPPAFVSSFTAAARDEEDDRPRGGLGSSRSIVFDSSITAATVVPEPGPSESTEPAKVGEQVEDDRKRRKREKKERKERERKAKEVINDDQPPREEDQAAVAGRSASPEPSDKSEKKSKKKKSQKEIASEEPSGEDPPITPVGTKEEKRQRKKARKARQEV
ncbi:hypothetical protein PUNSTDRAFT_115211 [Punctularia strigosozonata HHB-11173 SS5]|uniref:uncharacterized protein n=1 Tax=Punctularia strigosozonata (strain HHB-11173) TaxID=741275 RepID=UPI0004417C44|nr:uncharacterized protein PUNSTDRAFT_115211 [Punctularia strigosozonata HHB-11173 SS5]EIN06701.1 hypothetical protein PUNSTDRAFT_115211 [Punctularia strigosozonata HHB-11173 SS5]